MIELYDTKYAAKVIGISRGYIHRLLWELGMPRPTYKIGQSFVWTTEDIQKAKVWYNAREGKRSRK